MIKYINQQGLNKTLGDFPYIINKMEIGEIGATAEEQKLYNVDGSIFKGNSIGGRSIELEVSILCDNDTDLKQFKRELSQLFNPKLTGKLIINDKELNCICEGSPHYPTGDENRNTGYQRALIYLKALDPYYYSKDIYDLIATWNNNFTFEVELKAEGIEYATKSSSLIYNLSNGGDIDTGFNAEITVTATASNIYIHHINKNVRLEITGAFNIGDIIYIDTNKGNKRVTLLRGGVYTNIFNRLTINSDFFSLDLGNNDIRLGATTGEEGLQLVITHKEKFIDD